MQILEGNLTAGTARFALIVARFNSFITDRLLVGALDALKRSGASEDNLLIVRVPGAWEIPITAQALAKSGKHDAVICLGAVVRGDTPHFDYVAGESAGGLARLALEIGIPIANGILTTNTVEQAIDRAGAKSGNKGFDAAMTAIEMVNLLKQVSS
ncbi:MAG: 6,7-dimethyl-8-ribityllumazine synthase [Acidobacteriota bacterium]|nr:6,7-dimethyl-8-ribityllumazine synthase [Acidobacteriota bacterium]